MINGAKALCLSQGVAVCGEELRGANPAIASDQVNCLALGLLEALKVKQWPWQKMCPSKSWGHTWPKGTWQFSDFLVCVENQPRQPWPTETYQMLEYPDWLSRSPKLYG